MLKVAKLNAAGDKVEQVHNVKKEKCIDPTTGAPSENSVINFAVKLWGAGNYVWNKDGDKTKAAPGKNYDSSNKIFYEDRPQSCSEDLGTPVVFASWTLNTTTGEWQAPHMYVDGTTHDTKMGNFRWQEDTQKWLAKKGAEMVTADANGTTAADYQWNTSTNAWDAV